jgi:MYXO-CTERM domain-containing protein
MRQSTGRFAGLLLFVALLVGAPLLSAKDKKVEDCDTGRDDRPCVTAPDSHGGPLLAITAGLLGTAILVQRRRKITS